MSAVATLTSEQELELANLRAQFTVLSDEFNALDLAIDLNASDELASEAVGALARKGTVARALRACGLRISQIERIRTGGDIPGYAFNFGETR